MNVQRVALLAVLVGLAGCANEPRSTRHRQSRCFRRYARHCRSVRTAMAQRGTPSRPISRIWRHNRKRTFRATQRIRGHSRQDPAGYEYMWGLSHRLTDKQIKELAVHFAAQKPERQRVEGSPNELKRARRSSSPVLRKRRFHRVPAVMGLKAKATWLSASCRSASGLSGQAARGVSAHRRSAGRQHHENRRA